MADVGASTTARGVGELEAQGAGGEIVGGEALSRRLRGESARRHRAHRLRSHRRARDADRDHGRRLSTARARRRRSASSPGTLQRSSA